MCDLDDGSSISGAKILAKSGVCDGKVATDVEVFLFAGYELEALRTTSAVFRG